MEKTGKKEEHAFLPSHKDLGTLTERGYYPVPEYQSADWSELTKGIDPFDTYKVLDRTFQKHAYWKYLLYYLVLGLIYVQDQWLSLHYYFMTFS